MTPRLLTERQAADYLALPMADVRRLPVGRVTFQGKVRFDRVIIDRLLDGGLGLDAESLAALPALPANANETAGDRALAAFNQSRPHAARRSPR